MGFLLNTWSVNNYSGEFEVTLLEGDSSGSSLHAYTASSAAKEFASLRARTTPRIKFGRYLNQKKSRPASTFA